MSLPTVDFSGNQSCTQKNPGLALIVAVLCRFQNLHETPGIPVTTVPDVDNGKTNN